MSWSRARVVAVRSLRGRSLRSIALALVATLFVWVAVAGCAGRRAEPESAWVADQARIHAELDAALTAGKTQWAEETLLAALAERAPVGVEPEILALVRKDQLFRLADIYLVMGEPQRALDASDRGLALGDGRDLFTANLHIARGKALEALERAPEAAVALHRALLISDGLLHDLLAND